MPETTRQEAGGQPEPPHTVRPWRPDAVDSAVAGVVLAVCAALFAVTASFDEVSELLAQNIRPATFPRLLLAIISGLALALPFEHLLGTRGWRKIRRLRAARPPAMTWATLGVLLALAAAAPLLGAMLTIFGICTAMPLLWGVRRPVRVLLFAALFTAGVTLLFNVVLGVHFEPGRLLPAIPGLG